MRGQDDNMTTKHDSWMELAQNRAQWGVLLLAMLIIRGRVLLRQSYDWETTKTTLVWAHPTLQWHPHRMQQHPKGQRYIAACTSIRTAQLPHRTRLGNRDSTRLDSTRLRYFDHIQTHCEAHPASSTTENTNLSRIKVEETWNWPFKFTHR